MKTEEKEFQIVISADDAPRIRAYLQRVKKETGIPISRMAATLILEGIDSRENAVSMP